MNDGATDPKRDARAATPERASTDPLETPNPAQSSLFQGAPPSSAYKNLVLGLLVAAYALNFIDRSIIASLGQAIKVDLKISDTQLGLLGGLYFALLYTTLGIPLARLAERSSRVNIISASIVVWCGFTTLCGFAGNFASLAALRFGVGVGEAGLTPAAHSLISDYFEPRKRTSALGVFAFGATLGTMIAAIAGGWLAQHYSWRVAFVVLGIPGVLVALAIKLLIKELPRGYSEPPNSTEPVSSKPSRLTLKQELREVGDISAIVFSRWPLLNMVLGLTLLAIASYGGGQFVQPYFLRTFNVNYAQVGLFVGLIGGVSAAVGTLAGGFITDRLARSGAERWYAIVPALGVALGYPFIVATYSAPTWSMALLWLAVPGALSAVATAPTYGVIQNMFPPHRRATAIAVVFLFLNLIAIGGGPPFTGWMIDHFGAFHFTHPDKDGFWAAIVGGPRSDVTLLQTNCPGGLGAPGGGAALDLSCKHAIQLATRQGVILAYGFGLWGALHFLMASFGLQEALKRARTDRGEAS